MTEDALLVASQRGAVMGLVIEEVVIDCEDLERMKTFWCSALGYEHVWTGPSGGFLLAPKDRAQLPVALLPVRSRGDAPKNPVHLDLRPEHQAVEVARLEGLGARRVDIGQGEDVSWVVMADPEGNEFCVLRSRSESERRSEPGAATP